MACVGALKCLLLSIADADGVVAIESVLEVGDAKEKAAKTLKPLPRSTNSCTTCPRDLQSKSVCIPRTQMTSN